MPPTDQLTASFERLGLALAIGFLVGVERGWKQRDEPEGERVAGLRTFALIGLLGGVAGVSLPVAGPLFLGVVFLSFSGAFVAFELRRAGETHDNSATSVIAGLLVFCLGAYAALGHMVIAAAGGVATTALLAFKPGLHAWLKELTWKEIRSALLILAASFIALPLLPNAPIDPWNLINPRHLWLLVILIAAASFAGYVALRAIGPKTGLLVGALAGAVVSSTAVTLDLAGRVRLREIGSRDAAAAATLASIVMLARVGVLSTTFSPDIFSRTWAPLVAASAAMLVSAGLLRRFREIDPGVTGYRRLLSPLDLGSVARLAGMLLGLTVLANIVVLQLGARGLLAFAGVAGLMDADAVTLAVGNLARLGLDPRVAASAILLGALANSAFKIGVAAMAGGRLFALWFGLATAAGAIAGGLALLF